MKRVDTTDVLDRVIRITVAAGREILSVYQQSYQIENKADGSPVTTADLRAHELIVRQLSLLTPDIPVLSEESSNIAASERQRWSAFWLVDPLDGTKEFIKRNGEFTVNIALVENHRPVIGVVHTPVGGSTYYAATGQGAWRAEGPHAPTAIKSRRYDGGAARMVASRSHEGAAVIAFRDMLLAESGLPVESVNMGSSLKVCLVAEGKADVYPRLGLTSEWDTAAADCVLNEAGGAVIDLDGNPLQYNKANLLNPWFMATGDTGYDWPGLAQRAGVKNAR